MNLDDFPVTYPVPVRWADIDMYGHLNNAAYYQYFDTAINGWLATAAGVDAMAADAIDLVAESACAFHSSVAFGDDVTVGLGVRRLGRTSVTYGLGLFTGPAIAAYGHWVHVYVDRAAGKATDIPPPVRAALEGAKADLPEFVLGTRPGAD